MAVLMSGLAAATALLVMPGAGPGDDSSGRNWIIRFAAPAEVDHNQRSTSAVDQSPLTDEMPIVAVVNPTDRPVRVRTVRFLASRYIGIGSPDLDDWHLVFRESLEGMTQWDQGGTVVHLGPPTSWVNYPGATDRAGNPVQDTRLGGLDRFGLVIPPHSTRYVGIANRITFPENGLTFVMLSDRRLDVDDHAFVSVHTPAVQTIAASTRGDFKNAAVNVEVAPVPVRAGDAPVAGE